MNKIQRTFCYTTTNTDALNTLINGLIREHQVEIQQVIRTSEFEHSYRHPNTRSMDEASYIILALVPELQGGLPERGIPSVPKEQRIQMNEGINESVEDHRRVSITDRYCTSVIGLPKVQLLKTLSKTFREGMIVDFDCGDEYRKDCFNLKTRTASDTIENYFHKALIEYLKFL